MTEIETSERTMTVRRTFNAPRERVFEAWTDPKQVDQWWGPDGFTTTTDDIEVRPGGVWRFEMVGPEGEAYPNRVVFEEVEEPEHLAHTHGSPEDPELFQVTVTFEEREGGTTELTMHQHYESAAALEESIEEFGAAEGAKQNIDHLANYLMTEEAA